ncbi:hypothetical protein [Sinomonas sp. B1-1]|uniref:TY-Chap2 family putative peptide chaperone n=1 Tax=Sinomonas sp. B1-1 TaxID=3141454 RepID=UPI003D2CD14B
MTSLSISAEPGTIMWRHVNALSWRVLSELARRDNSLFVGLTGYGGSASHAHALMMTDGATRHYQARRWGLGFTAGNGGEHQIEWSEAFSMPSARSIAMDLERANGLNFPASSPPTSPRALGYRVLAAVLELTLGDAAQWEVCGFPARSFAGDANSPRLREWEDTAWSLRRDDEEVAQIDNFGHLRWGLQCDSMDLMQLYMRHDRRIIPLVSELFGRLLK